MMLFFRLLGNRIEIIVPSGIQIKSLEVNLKAPKFMKKVSDCREPFLLWKLINLD
ncbi:MAG: hypothetical protein PHP26_09660 [Syntrophomonas sp.]|nr:hypothetical protein [Syntrophomonas sp.]